MSADAFGFNLQYQLVTLQTVTPHECISDAADIQLQGIWRMSVVLHLMLSHLISSHLILLVQLLCTSRMSLSQNKSEELEDD